MSLYVRIVHEILLQLFSNFQCHTLIDIRFPVIVTPLSTQGVMILLEGNLVHSTTQQLSQQMKQTFVPKPSLTSSEVKMTSSDDDNDDMVDFMTLLSRESYHRATSNPAVLD